MTDREEQLELVGRFQESVAKVVGLGYGEDDCDPVVTVMFEQLVRDSVPAEQIKKLPFRLPKTQLENETTHAQILKQATQLQRFVACGGDPSHSGQRSSPVLFPFMTALGMGGGVFMLVFHVARFVPDIF